MRGREVFLFSQPRPIAAATATVNPQAALGATIKDLAPQFTPLETDLEAFAAKPVK